MHTRPFVPTTRRVRAALFATLAAASCLTGAPAFAQSEQPEARPAAAAPLTSSQAINDAWTSWRTALEARASFLDPRELETRLNEYKAWLAQLDASVPVAATVPADAPQWRRNIAAEYTARREAGLRQVLARVEPQAPILDDPALNAAIDTLKRDLASWQRRVELLAADLATIEQNLALARSLDEGNTSSTRTILEKWMREGLTRQPGLRAAIAPILDRVETLERVETTAGTGEVLRVLSTTPDDRPAVLFAAWRRLAARGQAAWPANADELQTEVALQPVLLAAASRVPDADRAAALKEEVRAEQGRRLTRLLSTVTDDATIAVADEAMTTLGVSEQTLDGRIRYNLLLNRLKRAVSRAGISDDQARAAAKTFVDSARSIPGGIAFLTGANSVVAAVDAVAGGLTLSPATVDPTRFGPSAAGLGTPLEDGPFLVFNIPSRSGVAAASLRFVLVGEGKSAAYITTHEITVGQVAAILAAANAERLLPEVQPIFTQLEDSRRGPRSWVWTHDQFDVPQIAPAPTWLSTSAVLGGVTYPADQLPEPPTADTPIQQFRAAATVFVANVAGCRLPTTGEWQALLNERAGNERRELANLRDQSWRAFKEHMVSLKQAGRMAVDPLDGVFLAAGAAVPGEESHPWNDGWLWFAPTADPQTAETSHVIGNVAELTTTRAWTLPENAADIPGFVTRNVGELRVIGGSALSDPALDPAKPLELDAIDALEGFADVGFRLAFGAALSERPNERVGQHLSEVLTPTPYLRPR